MLSFKREVPPVRRVPLALARRFVQICTVAAAEVVSSADLTPLEFAVLAYVNKRVGEPGIDQTDLANRLGVDRNSASLLVARLEARGLLERRVNGDDRRARQLHLTRRGENLHERLYSPALAGQWRVLEVLKPADRERLLDLLVQVIEGNRPLARPGSGRRKRGSANAPPSDKRK